MFECGDRVVLKNDIAMSHGTLKKGDFATVGIVKPNVIDLIVDEKPGTIDFDQCKKFVIVGPSAVDLLRKGPKVGQTVFLTSDIIRSRFITQAIGATQREITGYVKQTRATVLKAPSQYIINSGLIIHNKNVPLPYYVGIQVEFDQNDKIPTAPHYQKTGTYEIEFFTIDDRTINNTSSLELYTGLFETDKKTTLQDLL